MKTIQQKLNQIERMITFIVHSRNKSALMAIRWSRLIKLRERLTMKKVIWDSGFGYELGYLVERREFDSIVKLCTGITSGQNVLVYNHDVKPYSEDLQKVLDVQYNTKINKKFC